MKLVPSKTQAMTVGFTLLALALGSRYVPGFKETVFNDRKFLGLF